MKMKHLIYILVTVVLGMIISTKVQSQVVIALLFGDKLNSPGLKFGLDGGINLSSLTNISSAKFTPGFNLGLYFDILFKQNSNWFDVGAMGGIGYHFIKGTGLNLGLSAIITA